VTQSHGRPAFIDESGRDNQAGGVDLVRTFAGAQLADLGNSAVLDSDIAAIKGERVPSTAISILGGLHHQYVRV